MVKSDIVVPCPGFILFPGKYYVPFYGRAKFGCKTARLYTKLCEWHLVEMPGIREGMQSSEMMRNSLGLNYKSAALTS